MNSESPPLATKLFVPQLRPDRVPRPRLVAQLNRGLTGKLTLVSAPAGFGKTTLVADWLQQGGRPFTWLSLDEGDNEPTRFLTYLGAALARIHDDWSQPVEKALRAPQPPSPQRVVAAVINEITASERDLILALDDYHTISNPTIHETLGFLLEHLPPAMHLVLVTRADPPLPLARLRACGQLAEIRVDDLRFTAEEAASFLNRVMGLALTPQQIATLEARTEGWIAGLQLAALSLQSLESGKDIAGFMDAFAGSHRYVMDYLIEEVFSRQPRPIQEFLLQTSILERLCGPLCDAILDKRPETADVSSVVIGPSSAGQATLQYLEDRNLFTVPLDHERRWYRYHHLFADLLRDRLRQTQPERVPDLHRSAAAWYERHELMEEAVHHALKAQDFDLATCLIVRVTDALWARSEVATVLSWMAALPEELVYSRPRLSHIYASALANVGHLEAIEPLLQSVEAWLQEAGQLPSETALCLPEARQGTPGDRSPDDKEWRYTTPEGLLTMVDIRRGFVARFLGPIPDTLAFCKRALERTPAGNLFVRGMALLFQGHAHFLLGDMDRANHALERACWAGQASGHLAVYLSAAHYLAQLRGLQGRLYEAQSIYQTAAELVSEQGVPVYAGIEQIGLGDLLREWNDLEAATSHISEGLRLAGMGGDFVFLRDGYLARARLELALGNLDEALAFVRKAEKVVQHHRCPWEMALVGLWKARLCLARGDLARALMWVQTCGLSPDDEPRFLDELGHLTLAQVLLAQGRLDEAGRLLERLRQAAESAGRQGRLIQILIAQALVRQAGGDEAGALLYLERSLVLAEPEGYVRTFLDAGPGMTTLLRRASSRGIAPGYVARLLAASGQPPFPQPSVDQPLVEPLTPRELEVLGLIAAGLRNQEIADQLVISLATVKRHISNIYGKLGVSHRTQAVARGQELQLLQSPS
jgi:LuxR family maltose regulon positive regulatory protein